MGQHIWKAEYKKKYKKYCKDHEDNLIYSNLH